ncbi:MAG: hypothetical protein ACLFPX_02830 [Candidatus Omnitrophota bacterium]
MRFDDVMNTIRRWDNRCARWMMRHFYFFFFQVVLIVVFFVLFVNAINTIDLGSQLAPDSLIQHILHQNSVSLLVIIFLMLLNSFWMLFMFNTMNRIRYILKDIHYATLRNSQNRR